MSRGREVGIDEARCPVWFAGLVFAFFIVLYDLQPAGAQSPCSCPGDCNADCTTTRAELDRAVNAIFDPALAVCPAADADASGAVKAPDLLLVGQAITLPGAGCMREQLPTPTPTVPPSTSTRVVATRSATATPLPDGTPASTWIPLAPLGEGPRQEVGVTAVDDTIYVIGGFDGVGRVEAYDVSANEWTTVASLPQARNHIGAAAIGGFVYSVGGFVGNGFTPANQVYRYDPGRDVWREVSPLPTRRGALAVAAVGGLLYAVGGDGPTGNVTRHDVYEPDTGEWTQLPPLPSARNHLAAAAFDGRLYVVGGRFDGGGSNNSAALDRYDPGTQQWESLTSMPTARSGLAAAVLNGRLVVIGGEVNPAAPDGVFPQVEAYDFVTDTWQSLDPMPVPRHGIGAVAVGDLLYVPGGATRAGFGATDHHDALRLEAGS